jgi:PilZ domain-containing protein
MTNETDRRGSRRYSMELPLTVKHAGTNGTIERQGKTRDVSFKGLYFWSDAELTAGSEIEFTLTLPKEVTQAADVKIKCTGHIVRVEPSNGNRGIAAQIEHYEFLPAA